MCVESCPRCSKEYRQDRKVFFHLPSRACPRTVDCTYVQRTHRLTFGELGWQSRAVQSFRRSTCCADDPLYARVDPFKLMHLLPHLACSDGTFLSPLQLLHCPQRNSTFVKEFHLFRCSCTTLLIERAASSSLITQIPEFGFHCAKLHRCSSHKVFM